MQLLLFFVFIKLNAKSIISLKDLTSCYKNTLFIIYFYFCYEKKKTLTLVNKQID